MQALLESWAAAKKRAGPLRKAIKPLMEAEALRIAEELKAFEASCDQYRGRFVAEPVFQYDAEGGRPPATLTLSAIRAGGVAADAGATYLRAVLLEGPAAEGGEEAAGQEGLGRAEGAAAQTSGVGASEGAVGWEEEHLELRVAKGAPRPPLLQLRLWAAAAPHDGEEATPLASAEVRLTEGKSEDGVTTVNLRLLNTLRDQVSDATRVVI